MRPRTTPPGSLRAARYECDRCHRPIGETGRVRRSQADGIVLTALCAECLAAGSSLRLADDVDTRLPALQRMTTAELEARVQDWVDNG